MNKFKYTKWLLPVFAAAMGVSMVSCDDEPDKFELTDGTPSVHYVRMTSAPDSLVTEAYVDNLICLVGDNLTSIREMYFNDQKAVLNTSYITDHTLLVNIPRGIPEVETNKIYMYNKDGVKTEYDFRVLVPGPSLLSLSFEYAKPGDEVTLHGNYFVDDPNKPLAIMFPGDVPVTEIKSIEQTAVTFVIPEGATEEGEIELTTRYGSGTSKFHYLDTRGTLFNFDEGLQQQGWHKRDIITDDWSFAGNYLQLGDGDAIMSEDGGWDDSNFSFEYWAGSWDTPQNITSGQGAALYNVADFSKPEKMALKFEMCIPSTNPWAAGAMQVCFQGLTQLSLSSNPISGISDPLPGAQAWAFNGEVDAAFKDRESDWTDWGRYLYRPWQNAEKGEYHTDGKWITVTLPISQFRYTAKGTGAGKTPSKREDFASLTMFVVSGGVNGKECQPIIKIDNIRAVINE
jgi:hypothetical protein